ncbi:hypothetical protein H0H87_011528, partial [Tephrocybe sp. NHM501043]
MPLWITRKGEPSRLPRKASSVNVLGGYHRPPRRDSRMTVNTLQPVFASSSWERFDCLFFFTFKDKLIMPNRQTGVGKSRLINKTFGVDDAIVSDIEAGYADIDKEIYSKENPLFILHDSRGFEQGDDANVKIVQRFINDRSKMPLIKDKLHAVWLCIDIPLAGGRLLESGIEQFLKLKIEGKLGHVPVIAVFTKYDLLVVHENRLLKQADREGKPKEAIAGLIEQNAYTILNEICAKPFDAFVERKVPHVTVSTEYGYEARLADLIQVTYERVREQLVDASVVTAMAQRVNPNVNIQASIA